MEYKFSERVLTLKPSAIREIFKYAADPTYISLSAGNPAPEAFPVKPLAEISAKLMAENPILALQYSTTEGYTPLRDHLRAYMREKHNTGRDFDDILITSGAQQIMDLFTKSILNEGETVLTEAPSFIGTLNDFRSYRAKLVGIPMDTDGMNMEALEKALRTEKNVKFIYTIPNFQNPSGITMSLEKRKKLYDLAKQYGVMILEDNPYGDLRYAGEALPTIKSFDEEGIVLYAGSFLEGHLPGHARRLRDRPEAGARQDDRLQAGPGRAHEYLVAGALPPLYDRVRLRGAPRRPARALHEEARLPARPDGEEPRAAHHLGPVRRRPLRLVPPAGGRRHAGVRPEGA